jgi:hypothetical protein
MSIILSTPLRRICALLFTSFLCASQALCSESRARIPVLILTGESRTDWRWTSTHLRDRASPSPF